LAVSVATIKGVERFDGNTGPHVHFICQECDAVIDLMDMEIPDSLKSVAEHSSGGQVAECQLCFTGICQDCLEKHSVGGVQ
jgi:Fur family peroxide stress response transcriptional regulator